MGLETKLLMPSTALVPVRYTRGRTITLLHAWRLLLEYSSKNLVHPHLVPLTSYEKVWWRCSECGHIYKSKVVYRFYYGSGCPACDHKVVTWWNNLRATHPRLAQDYSSKNPLPANKVFAGSKKKFYWRCPEGHRDYLMAAYGRLRGRGCPRCAHQIIELEDSLAYLYPRLAAEYSRLNPISPNEISPRSGRKVGWQCGKCKHPWRARVVDRVRDKNGCPACAGKVLKRINSLLVVQPRLAKEFSSRNEVLPVEVFPSSSKKYWWECPVCGWEYEATANNRVKGSGCPACAKKVPSPAYNLLLVHPELAKEYSPTNPLLPDNILPASHMQVLWYCSRCGEDFSASPRERHKGRKCPCFKKKP